jgi:hypothetical protein
MESIKEYQQDCYERYKEDIGYTAYYRYLYGNPINVLVPIETAQKQYMIVGAYPSAKFYTVKKQTEVMKLTCLFGSVKNFV